MSNTNNIQSEQLKPTQLKPWLKYYSEESLNHPLPKCTIYSYLKKTSKDNRHDVALYYYGTEFTFGDLIERADQAANAYAAIGVKPGEIVSFLTVAVPETIFSLYGLNRLGAVSNYIDPRMDVERIRNIIQSVHSNVLIVIDQAWPKVKDIIGELGVKKVIVQSAADSLPFMKKVAMKAASKVEKIPYSDKVITWKQFAKMGEGKKCKEYSYKENAVAAITHTGGTTGTPKGVLVTNDGMNAVSVNFAYAGFQYERRQSFLNIMPIFSAYGCVCGLHMPLTMGLRIVLIPKFVPEQLGYLVKKYKCNHMMAVPAFYEMMMNSKELQKMDLSFLQMIGSGGDSMNAALEKKFDQFLKQHGVQYPIAQGYGMSELSAAASFNFNYVYKSGSVGIPSLTTTIGIFKPGTAEEVGFNEEGEVCVTGPSMMKGYYNNPEETANVMRKHPDGKIWIHSGDLGYMDEDGFLFIKGRVKHMITRFDGHKVFPVQIESVVAEHPAVHNCAAIGIADMDHGQGMLPLVLVEIDADADKEAICKELFDICNTRLEERGRPVAVIPIDQIPLTPVGKNDFRTLTKQYEGFDYKALAM